LAQVVTPKSRRKNFDGKSQPDFFLRRIGAPEILLVQRLIFISAVVPAISSAHIGRKSPAVRRRGEKKLFSSSNIYNETSETFAGA